MKKICFVLTTDVTIKAFLLSHLLALSKFYDIVIITNTNNSNFLNELGIKSKVIPLSISRDINLFSDLINLIILIKIFYKESFSSVHSITPKAGLLAMLAAWLTRVPLRIHTFTGQVWVTKSGFSRFLLKSIDRLIALITTHNIVDSQSQRRFLINENIITCDKSIVFCKGSISGVDVKRFKPDSNVRNKIRSQLNLAQTTIVFLFVGRLTRDKGVLDLAKAFSQLHVGSAHLIFVGTDEQNVRNEIMHIVGSCEKYVHFIEHTDHPEHYMSAADVLCLPSYREGFGSVVIEAAAVGIPAIASRIYGLTDAILEGETGLLHDAHDIDAIKKCLESLTNNQNLRTTLGKQAMARAIKDFDCQNITQAWLDFYYQNIK